MNEQCLHRTTVITNSLLGVSNCSDVLCQKDSSWSHFSYHA